MTSSDRDIRVGVLGAASIVKMALLAPASKTPGITVSAIAARSRDRAVAYARKHGIPRVHDSYENLLASPEVDAVYVPLPASLHGEWTARAIAAGKHVLCEKPFTANADEAREIVDLADASDRVVMEAFHSAYHPLWTRVGDLLAAGTIGDVQSASATFRSIIFPGKDIRWQRRLGGGALMDLGVYPIGLLRALFGEPVVTGAQGTERDGVDTQMRADLTFNGDVTGEVVTSMWSRHVFSARLEVIGASGSLKVSMPYHPQMGAKITTFTESGRTVERADGRSSFDLQLAAFRDAIAEGSPVLTDARHGLATMRVVDAIYEAAGMQPRARHADAVEGAR